MKLLEVMLQYCLAHVNRNEDLVELDSQVQ